MKTPEEILDAYKQGVMGRNEAIQNLMESRCTNLGHTRVDLDRHHRTGAPEVIYGEGKTPGQIISIAHALLEKGDNVLATRLTDEAAAVFQEEFPDAVYSSSARLASIVKTAPDGKTVLTLP